MRCFIIIDAFLIIFLNNRTKPIHFKFFSLLFVFNWNLRFTFFFFGFISWINLKSTAQWRSSSRTCWSLNIRRSHFSETETKTMEIMFCLTKSINELFILKNHRTLNFKIIFTQWTTTKKGVNIVCENQIGLIEKDCAHHSKNIIIKFKKKKLNTKHQCATTISNGLNGHFFASEFLNSFLS